MPSSSRIWFPIFVDDDALTRYESELAFNNREQALVGLAAGIASSPSWRGSNCSIVARPWPEPRLAVIGQVSEQQRALLAAESSTVNQACRHLKYVSLREAELVSEELSHEMIRRLGKDQLTSCAFTAIPRGGYVVLGFLSYLLDLERAQLDRQFNTSNPLIVVDDCVLSGLRVKSLLDRCENQRVVIACLYSHQAVRDSALNHESRLIDFIYVRELGADIQPNCPAKMRDGRYWFGDIEFICFAWNEPDRIYWDNETESIGSRWHIIPPELCIKHRSTLNSEFAPAVQLQPRGIGLLAPSANALFGEHEGEIIIGNLATKEYFGLEGVAADAWLAVVREGSVASAVETVSRKYDADEATVRRDLERLTAELCERGLLEIQNSWKEPV